MDLKAALLQERLGVYVRLRGGYTFPLAGAIWLLFPDQRTTWVPASVSIVYLLTVIAILADSRRLAATFRSAGQA